MSRTVIKAQGLDVLLGSWRLENEDARIWSFVDLWFDFFRGLFEVALSYLPQLI